MIVICVEMDEIGKVEEAEEIEKLKVIGTLDSKKKHLSSSKLGLNISRFFNLPNLTTRYVPLLLFVAATLLL